jgi:GNAT superfamily N-acetyltransferase
MEVIKRPILTYGIKHSALQNLKEIGRERLFFINNDLHLEPFAYIEDVFVSEQQRGRGIGTRLLGQLIHDAQSVGCYKVIACSRFENLNVHDFYEKMGFKKHGYEFRLENILSSNKRKI